jgi:hypothetical protein
LTSRRSRPNLIPGSLAGGFARQSFKVVLLPPGSERVYALAMTRRSLAVACADLQAVLPPGWRAEI